METEAQEKKAKTLAKLGEETVEIQFPDYRKPISWMIYAVKELHEGDAIIWDNDIFIVVKRYWWKSKKRNVMCLAHLGPPRYKYAGDIDFFRGYKGYVHAQQMDKMGVDMSTCWDHSI